MRFFSFICLFCLLCCNSKKWHTQTQLDLSNKNLTTLPDSILEMSDLVFLNLGNNFTWYAPLSSLPDQKVKTANKIKSLPNGISRLTHLKTLVVAANDLESLPGSIAEMEALDTLDISFNYNLHLSKEITKLQKMRGLKFLNIAGISADQQSIKYLRSKLPSTKVIASIEELLQEIPK